MQSPIDSVRRGLAKFTDQIIERDINARYMVVLFGLYPEIVLDWVDDGYLCRDTLAQVRAALPNNFEGPQNQSDVSEFMGNVPKWLAHDNHDCVNCNTREASFETINMVLGKAVNNVIVRRTDSRSANLMGPVRFRPGAQKFIIHVTNEDNDCPWYFQNTLVNVSLTNGRDGAGRMCGKGQDEGVVESGSAFSPPSPFPNVTTGTVNDLWMKEIEVVVANLIADKVSIYMFVLPNSGQSKAQFGDPALAHQSTDLSGYSPTTTLRNYDASPYKDAFLPRMLRANINATARVFDIAQISNSMFVDAFFREIVNEVTPDCFMKRQVTQPQCFDYKCKCDVGCVATPICLPECQQCNFKLNAADAAPTCLAENAVNPNNTCQTCNPVVTKNAWTTCDDANPCTTDTCTAGMCSFNVLCTAQCGFCNIDGKCYPKATSKPMDLVGCEVCDPMQSFSSWTRTTACTAAPTPRPTPPPTPMPTPMPTLPPTPDNRVQCHTYGACSMCRAPETASHRLCKWCYVTGTHLDTDGTCSDEQSSCFSPTASFATATMGVCPQEAPTPPPTPGPTTEATTTTTLATTTTEPTTLPPTTTTDAAIVGTCRDGMEIGDKIELDDSFATLEKHCVCGPERTLLCVRDKNSCALDVTKEKCEARGADCCYRETALGKFCFPKANAQCAQQTTTVGDGNDGTGSTQQSRVTNEFGEEVVSAASKATAAAAAVAAVAAVAATAL